MRIYILTHGKRLAYAKKIKEILSDCPYEYFFVYGRGNTEKLEPFVEFDFDEAYENLPEKTFCLVEHFLKTSTDEKLVKMDDDNFLDWEKLKRFETAPEDYIGHFHRYGKGYKHDSYFHWYKIQNPAYKTLKPVFDLSFAEGAMYILSRKACEKITNTGREFFKNTPETYLGEDIKIGLCLKDDFISRRDIKQETNLHYEITEDFMSIHPVSLIVLEKLKSAKTIEEKSEILTRFNILNENVKRENFLRKIQPTMNLH